MDTYLLGIDIGTSGCKFCIINHEGKLVTSASHEYNPLIIKQGWIEQDPTSWYKAVIITLNKLGIDFDLKNITAIGIAGQMRGVTLIDSSGNIVRNSILWNDLRNVNEVNEINNKHSDIIQRITKNPLNTMCTLPKVLWVMKNEPDNWDRTYKVIYPKDYINFKLTGNLQTDMSDASGSSYYDMQKQDWSDEILDLFSINREKLPDIYPSTTVIGEVSKIASDGTGISAGVPVVAGGSDSTVESFSIGLINSSQCKIRLGTSGALSTIMDSIDFLTNSRNYCWSYILKDRWMLDANTRSCAQAVKWLRDVFYKDRLKNGKTYDEIDDEAMEVPVGSEGLFFHPYLLGEDAPYWDPNLKGAFSGISLNHGRSHFARSVYEGTAFALKDAMSIFGDLANGFEENIFIGGGVKSKCWLSTVTDVLGIDGRVAASADAAYGASMLAGVGIGVFNDAEEAIRVCSKTEKYVKYNRENHKAYQKLFYEYKEIKEARDKLEE
ncbi:MAG: xylulokinase [Actinobacteria bacterium]|nr:xylulokinase [Actinomycetota bacterium]